MLAILTADPERRRRVLVLPLLARCVHRSGQRSEIAQEELVGARLLAERFDRGRWWGWLGRWCDAELGEIIHRPLFLRGLWPFFEGALFVPLWTLTLIVEPGRARAIRNSPLRPAARSH